MLIENQMIKMKWNPSNRKWYESKGYNFSSFGDEFIIYAEDLSPNSLEMVDVICDYCGGVIKKNFC